MKKTVLFDLDGTLLDTLGDLAAAVNSMLSGFSFPTRTVSEVRSFIGNGVPTLVRRSLPKGVDDALHAEAVARFTEYYLAHMCDTTRPYPGIRELLSSLRTAGYAIGIVSNKKSEATSAICQKLLGGLYDYAAGASNEAERKPAPAMLNAALAALGCSSDEAVYVGDSDVDLLASANAKIDCISVSWGYRDALFLQNSGAKTVVSSPDELYSLLAGMR